MRATGNAQLDGLDHRLHPLATSGKEQVALEMASAAGAGAP